MTKPELHVIAGPTACGKTGLSLELAQKIGGEIISADSMQVYKYMDIGTAKIRPEETRGIRHYMIDELFPDEEFSIAIFQERARKYIAEIISRGKTPIMVGGAGFYINSVLYGNDFPDAPDRAYRESLYASAEEKGNAFLHARLAEADPESAALIHPNNVKRTIRALEFYKQTGKKISDHNLFEKKRKPAYNVNTTILTLDRYLMYDKIDGRVDKMLKAGLVAEVEGLLTRGYHEGLVSMQGIGYKETAEYLRGRTTLEDAVAAIKQNTRRYAKRQLTWFKNSSEGRIIDKADFGGDEDICDFILGK